MCDERPEDDRQTEEEDRRERQIAAMLAEVAVRAAEEADEQGEV